MNFYDQLVAAVQKVVEGRNAHGVSIIGLRQLKEFEALVSQAKEYASNDCESCICTDCNGIAEHDHVCDPADLAPTE